MQALLRPAVPSAGRQHLLLVSSVSSSPPPRRPCLPEAPVIAGAGAAAAGSCISLYYRSNPSFLKYSWPLFPQFPSLSIGRNKARIAIKAAAVPGVPSPVDESERAKLAQRLHRVIGISVKRNRPFFDDINDVVAKRLEDTSRYFKRLGSLGFWGQLVCTLVAAGILSFSAVVTGKITSPATFYATAGGIAAAFISVFWSFGYIRLSERLQKTANEPAKAPPRADVVKSLKNGIGLNLLGMGAAILGMQATVGLLVAKALTTSAVPYYQGISPGQSPVLALDVFLVQASANTILSHFLGLVFSLELLRSVTLPYVEAVPIPKVA